MRACGRSVKRAAAVADTPDGFNEVFRGRASERLAKTKHVHVHRALVDKGVAPDVFKELAARYCRMAYEAGFSPICPILYLPLFINDAIPEEHKNGIDMRRDMLRRSHVLVVCGDEVDEDVKNDIAVAKRLNITATTLDGILTVNQQGRHDV